MKRVAVFGNAGGGKSTLARRLAEITGLPLHPLDRLQFRAGGAAVPHEEYLAAHADLIRRDTWIIDGYGCAKTVWERLAAADTLVHVDLPLLTHYFRVTKCFFQGLVRTPEGWPEGSPMLSSTISSYRVVWPCHRYLTPRYRAFHAAARADKRVHHLRSPQQVEAFLREVQAAASRPFGNPLPGDPPVE